MKPHCSPAAILAAILACSAAAMTAGCLEPLGYSNQSLFPNEVATVYVKMFENRSYRRGVEYELTDAICKRIEAETPYKIVSSQDRADSVLSGQINSISWRVLSAEHKTGRALEREVVINATVNWKNLKTADMLVDNEKASSSANYSKWQNQGFKYASSLAANNLARQVVELMEKQW